MSLPASSFHDGSDDARETFPGQKPSPVHRLMVSLDAACAALKELNPGARRELRDDPRYMEKVSQLVSPIYSLRASGDLTTEMDAVHASTFTRPPILRSISGLKEGLPVRALSPEDPPLEVSLIRQLKLVEMYLDQKRHPGDLEEKSYLVSVHWWNWWVKICDTSLGARDAEVRYTMEPVDNSSLVDHSTKSLRTGLTPAVDQGVKKVSTGDFVYVPRTVWETCFERWFGEATYTLIAQSVSKSSPQPEVVDIFDGINGPFNKPAWKPSSRTKIIDQLAKRGKDHGECYHFVSKKWWALWRLRDQRLPVGSGAPRHTGPIDNEDLLNDRDRLRDGIRQGHDYMYIPTEAWYLLKAWYGVAHSQFDLSRDVDGNKNIMSR